MFSITLRLGAEGLLFEALERLLVGSMFKFTKRKDF